MHSPTFKSYFTRMFKQKKSLVATIQIYVVNSYLWTPKPGKNMVFKPPNILVITPKNAGCTVGSHGRWDRWYIITQLAIYIYTTYIPLIVLANWIIKGTRKLRWLCGHFLLSIPSMKLWVWWGQQLAFLAELPRRKGRSLIAQKALPAPVPLVLLDSWTVVRSCFVGSLST